MAEQGYETTPIPGASRRLGALIDAAGPYVTRRLAPSWGHGLYPDFRDGKESPCDVATRSDEGLAEVLAYIAKVGPSLKGTDWSGSGWRGKGRKPPRK